MADCTKLRDPHLNVSAHPAYGELARTLENVRNEEPVERLDGLRRVLDTLLECPRCSADGETRTLDLIAHANQNRLLQLGRSVIDPTSEDVRRFFEHLAADRVLERLQIGELRLLGCETAMSREGQRAIRDLTQILGIRVMGTTRLVYSAYFGELGFKDRYERMLRDASNLPELEGRRTEWPDDPLPPLAPPLDLDRLQSVPVDQLPAVTWPRIGGGGGSRSGLADVADVRSLVDLVDGRDGRVMTQMLARPLCELLVGAGPGRVLRIEFLFDFELVRVHPVDAGGSAIYRVRNPGELGEWLGNMDRIAAA